MYCKLIDPFGGWSDGKHRGGDDRKQLKLAVFYWQGKALSPGPEN